MKLPSPQDCSCKLLGVMFIDDIFREWKHLLYVRIRRLSENDTVWKGWQRCHRCSFHQARGKLLCENWKCGKGDAISLMVLLRRRSVAHPEAVVYVAFMGWKAFAKSGEVTPLQQEEFMCAENNPCYFS